ncbi:MAG: hypothetical protein HYR88_08165 [Verrucomicrobia bacterium]|nr:hypothetical protein [Verrucomicrobiota bacterium]MBI3868457.1 hypothetical protein [Verrucomicrobiota bacterium]
MNHNPLDPSSETTDLASISQRATASIRASQRRVRILSSLALLLGFLAVAASALVVSTYFIFYRPKEKEVLRQVTLAAERAQKNPPAADGAPAARLPFDFPSVQATMTFFHSLAIALLAGAVGLLAVGTLIVLAVLLLNRRATLEQVGSSLAQISSQLRELQFQKPPP